MWNRRALQFALVGGLLAPSLAKAQDADVDPTKNIVVFDIAGRKPYISSGATRADDCILQIWMHAPVEVRSAVFEVKRIYSEWEPSNADTQFIQRVFPDAYLTYSFERPGPEGWDAAFAAARKEIERVTSKGR